MKRLWWIVILSAALGCLDERATAGILKVNLTMPNGAADGAILLTVRGPAVPLSAAAGTGLRLFAQSLTSTNHFAVTGTLASGTILTIEVPDVSQASAYTATIDQVAGSNYQLRALTGYSLTLAP